jgi:hypothetical protein
MFRHMLLAATILFFLSSCDTGMGNNNVCPQGTVILYNDSNNPYAIHIDDTNIGVMQGQTTAEYTLDRGGHTIRVVQITGYLGQPTDLTGGVFLEGCDTQEFTFP